jgi:hypothetical protein
MSYRFVGRNSHADPVMRAATALEVILIVSEYFICTVHFGGIGLADSAFLGTPKFELNREP